MATVEKTPKKTPAVETEATSSEINFTFNGVTYAVPETKLWPLEVVEAQEDGRVTHAVRGILGEDQYKAFKKSYGGKPTFGDFESFVEELFESLDLDPKE